MIARVLVFAAFLPLSALAQLQVYQFDGTNDTLVGSLVNVGGASPGDILKTRFHVRNTGAGPGILQTLSLAGEGFTIVSAPSLPYTLSPFVTGDLASEAEIDIDFSPTIIASYSANLLINTISIVLEGSATPSAIVTLTGSTAALSAGTVVNFGSVAVGSTKTVGFVLSNSSAATITVATLAVSGSDFTLAPLKTPLQVGSGQSVPFQITFTPQSGTSAQGVLTVDTRAFNLSGQGLEPPLPSATIVFASSVGGSAQQNSVSIPLASASQVIGNGTLTLTFESSVTGHADDAAIQFLSGKLREATVSIAPGDTAATFDGQSSITFQTGTTAGTMTFTLTLNGNPAGQATLVIPPSPINLETVTAVRLAGALNVAFSGFDNTYSASQIAFTFYDLKGLALPQGVIDVDAASAFQQYFSTTQAGGMFALLAAFPVQGDTSQIGFVLAQLTNSAGATTAQQIPFAN